MSAQQEVECPWWNEKEERRRDIREESDEASSRVLGDSQ